MGDFLASSGGLGAIGTLAQGVGIFNKYAAVGSSADGLYGAAATNAMIEASALSSQYKVGAINMILQAEAQRAEYEYAAANYEIEGMGKRGNASMYDMQAALSLLNKANTLRSAASLGASALDAVRQGAEAESKLREEGRLFRGTQRAAIASGGTDVQSGNALDILRQTDEGIESDSASIRLSAQKNRYSLLQQQKNMWMRAEAEQLESENYRIAAENLRNAAEVSDLAADNMRKMGDLAYSSGQAGADMYNRFAELALQSGQISAGAYRQLGSVASGAARTAGYAGLLASVGEAAGMLAVKPSGNKDAGGVADFRYSMLTEDGWGDISYSAGTSDWWKKNEYKLGSFVPKVKTYGGI